MLAWHGEYAVVPERHLFQIMRGGDRDEDEVAAGKIGGRGDDAAAAFSEALDLGARPIVDRDIGARLGQPLGHGITHAASGADPTNLVLLHVECHAALPRPSRPLFITSRSS